MKQVFECTFHGRLGKSFIDLTMALSSSFVNFIFVIWWVIRCWTGWRSLISMPRRSNLFAMWRSWIWTNEFVLRRFYRDRNCVLSFQSFVFSFDIFLYVWHWCFRFLEGSSVNEIFITSGNDQNGNALFLSKSSISMSCCHSKRRYTQKNYGSLCEPSGFCILYGNTCRNWNFE